MHDERIVALYWERDEAALAATQEKYDRYLTKVAYNILTDLEDSRESVNDTYMAAWSSIPPHKPSVLSTYLGKITRRVSIDRLRKRHSEKRQISEYALSLDELGEQFTGGDTPQEAAEVRLLADTIGAFLRTLPTETRALFIGRYYFLDPLREVARYCGMSEAKAKSQLFRTRQRLRANLQKEGFDV